MINKSVIRTAVSPPITSSHEEKSNCFIGPIAIFGIQTNSGDTFSCEHPYGGSILYTAEIALLLFS